MLTFYQQYAKSIYDQNGETGILEECLQRIGRYPQLVAEWGANDGEYCSNTRHFIENGAKGIWIEGDENLYEACKENIEDLDVDLYCAFVTPENVNELIPSTCDIISIDTDGTNDYYTWKAFEGRVPIVVIEINSSYPPDKDILEDGASYSIVVKLGIEKGYFLVCHTGNLLFVLNEYRDKFPEIIGDGLSNSNLYFNKLWLK